jgi:RNA polymerase sigma-70 factor (ECF subfamily)
MNRDHDLSEASDAALVISVARSDSAALEEIYRRHGGTVFGLALRVLQDRASAEEVTQEVLIRLWNTPERFDPERGSLRSFLCAQTHSRCIDLIRAESARRRRQDREAMASSRAPMDVENQVANVLVADQLRGAVADLPDVERRAIELAYFSGLTYREVAEYLEVPEGTIKSRIRSGLRTLNGALTRQGLTIGELTP